MPLKIGIDVMGGDYATEATIKGAILAAEAFGNNAKVVLIGDEATILRMLAQCDATPDAFEIAHASQVIDMHEHPTKALVQKPDSSISVGLALLRDGKIDAFSSAGNTGAVLVGSMRTVKSIQGVIRPCITSCLPKENGGTSLILDVGTNADCKPDVLYQFGMLGSIYSKILTGNKNPKVALLNIGEEPEKGNLVTLSAHQLMKDSKDFNFAGNVEGRDLFSDKADVIVCDGFAGNIVLKTAEAFYSLIMKRKKSDSYFDRFNYEIYGGTPILGINGTVLIGHGISSPEAIKNMMIHSKQVAEAKLHEKINEAFN